MNSLKADGNDTFSGGVYDRVDIDGRASVNGDLSAQTIHNDGLLSVKGSVDCREFLCDGTASIMGNAGAEHMSIDGSVSVSGNLHCNRFSCDGMATVRGDALAERATVDGTVSILGSAQCSCLECDGTADIKGDANVTRMEIDGTVSISGNLQCDSFQCDGTATIRGNFTGKEFASSGTVNLLGVKFEGTKIIGDGCITAQNAQISADVILFEGRIDANELVGETVTVCSDKPHRHPSKINLVEATTVDLTGVIAGTVNGNNICLNEHCRIDCVDCTGTLYIHPSSRVGTITGEYQLA